ncbi:hypothetical protein F4861DRAFT_49469 [Xylaria intraflava]|nr:hypothetical protein F4861DRAFT_49469 [Xylaria intraflava]
MWLTYRENPRLHLLGVACINLSVLPVASLTCLQHAMLRRRIPDPENACLQVVRSVGAFFLIIRIPLAQARRIAMS